MAVKTRSDLKDFFQTGDKPTQDNFVDLIDSFVHMSEGDDNEGQIKNTLHISSSETYISGGVEIPLGLGVSGSILPGTDKEYDLGSPTQAWRHLYVSTGSIYFVNDSGSGEVETLASITLNDSASNGDDNKTLQFRGKEGTDNMDVEFRQIQAGESFTKGHLLNDGQGYSSTDVYGKSQQYMGGGDGQAFINRPEYTSLAPFGRKLVAHNINAQGRGSLAVTLMNYTGDGDGFFRVEKGTTIPGVGTPLFEVSESHQAIVYGEESELKAEGQVRVIGKLKAEGSITASNSLFSGSLKATGQSAFTNNDVIIENAVTSQPGKINQNFTIGVIDFINEPATQTMIGVGNDNHIKIEENIIVKIANGSTLKIITSQPDATANSSQGSITLSDPTVTAGGDIVMFPDNGGNPTILNQNTTIPAGQVANWTEGNNLPGTYFDDESPLNNKKGIQIGASSGVVYNGIIVNGVTIFPSVPSLESTSNIKLRIKDGAVLRIRPKSNIITTSENETLITGTSTFDVSNSENSVTITGSEGTTLNVSGGLTTFNVQNTGNSVEITGSEGTTLNVSGGLSLFNSNVKVTGSFNVSGSIDSSLFQTSNNTISFKSGVGSPDGSTLKKYLFLNEDDNAAFEINQSGYFVISGAGAFQPRFIMRQNLSSSTYANSAPQFDFERILVDYDDATIGQINFRALNNSGSLKLYSSIKGLTEEASSGSEGGKIVLQVASHDGELKTGLSITDGNAEDEIDVIIGSGTNSSTTVSGSLTVMNGINHSTTTLGSVDALHCGSTTGHKFTVQNQLQGAIADGDTSALFTVGNTNINTDSVIYGTLNGTTTLVGGLSQSVLSAHISSNNSMSFCFVDGEGGETIADDTSFTASFVIF